jgi:glycosyltransferase involved in cell wall biosynthesis
MEPRQGCGAPRDLLLNLKITIVTPSYNQGKFLPECLDSILSQKYPNLDYVVMDGGSTDNSAEIIRTHGKYLSAYRIEKDEGQYDAINRGFSSSHGGPHDIMGWLNSDDKHTPWTLRMVNEIFCQYPFVEWISTLYPLIWSLSGFPVRTTDRAPFSAAEFFLGANAQKNYLQQESTFWRRSLWNRSGGFLDTRWRLAADFELWARFFLGAHCYGVTTILGGFRQHPSQKTSTQLAEYNRETNQILCEYQKKISPQFLLRHRLGKRVARFFGKKGSFQQKGWLAPSSYFQHKSFRKWVLEGPRVYGSSFDRGITVGRQNEGTKRSQKKLLERKAVYCTYFDHNYLAQGLALFESLEKHAGRFELWVLAHSPECEAFLKRIQHPCLKILSIGELLGLNPQLEPVQSSRSPAEFYFTASPVWFRHVLERVPIGTTVTKIDADCFLFSSPEALLAGDSTASIVITPHRHGTKHSSRYGIYNVGWVSVQSGRLGVTCARKWEQQCLEWCFDKPDGKRYADQKYLDNWPSRYPDLHISNCKGANLAYWNVNRSELSVRNGKILVDGEPLVFYHFSGLKKISHGVYDPQWEQYGVLRNDVLLQRIYHPYLQALRRQEKRHKIRFGTRPVRYKQTTVAPSGKLKILRRVLRGQYLFAR